MTEVDWETWQVIQREIREGTPDTPERIALIKRADAAYAAYVRCLKTKEGA